MRGLLWEFVKSFNFNSKNLNIDVIYKVFSLTRRGLFSIDTKGLFVYALINIYTIIYQ